MGKICKNILLEIVPYSLLKIGESFVQIRLRTFKRVKRRESEGMRGREELGNGNQRLFSTDGLADSHDEMTRIM